MSAAAAVAGDTAGRLSEDHPDFAWACNVAGRALHFTSEEEAAFERFEAARRTATTDEDTKEALWGSPSHHSRSIPALPRPFLDELESRLSRTISTFDSDWR